MKKILPLLLTFTVLISCKKEEHSWLQEYQQTKCKWNNTEEHYKKDSLLTSNEFAYKLAELNKKIKLIREPYQKKIEIIQQEIEDAHEKHLEISRKLTDAQTQKYGHRSTAEYQRNLDLNQQNEDQEVSPLNFSLTTVRNKMENNASLSILINDRDKLMKKINELTRMTKAKYQPTFDSLQIVLNTQNTGFKEILSQLREPEKQKFINQRDSIRLNPCKQIKN